MKTFMTKKLKVRGAVKDEWTTEDISDFMADFTGVTDEMGAHRRSLEVESDQVDAGETMEYARAYGLGYEQALLDILNQIEN